MARKTHTEAQMRYDKVNRRPYGFRLHNELDSDIIAKLASVDSMQGYIKQLIRDDLARTRSAPTSPVPETDIYKRFVPGKQDLPSNSDKVKCLIKVAVDAGIEKELLEELKKL